MNIRNTRGIVTALAFVLSMTVAFAGGEQVKVDVGSATRSAIARTGGGEVMMSRLVDESGQSLYRMVIVDAGNRFDVDVNAASGEVTKFAKRKINNAKTSPRGMVARESRLDADQVRPTVLAATGGGVVIRTDRKTAVSGAKLYDFEISKDGALYNVEVDANSGDIVHFEETAIQSIS